MNTSELRKYIPRLTAALNLYNLTGNSNLCQVAVTVITTGEKAAWGVSERLRSALDWSKGRRIAKADIDLGRKVLANYERGKKI